MAVRGSLQTSPCTSPAEEGFKLTWRTLDVAADAADVLATSGGAEAIWNAQVSLCDKVSNGSQSLHVGGNRNGEPPTPAVLQSHLARIGVCLAFQGGAQGLSHRSADIASAGSADIQHPATISLFGGRSANVDWAEHAFRR